MIINLGSTNLAKQEAVKLAFSHYFNDTKINPIKADSQVHHQPKSLNEIVKGAKNRAIQAFKSSKCDLGIGIESGIFPFPEVDSGYMDTSCTVIFDGNDFFIGSSPCFEYPKKVINSIINENKEVAEIFKELKLGDEDLRHKKGAVGLLTKGVITRETYTESSVVMALIKYLNKELYR